MRTPFSLRAWQSALNVARKTRAVVDAFPHRGYSELKIQMVDSAESISHAIAEGRGSESQREFNRFLDISNKSASELSSQVTMAMAYGIVANRKGRDLLGSIECTRTLVESLQKTIRAEVESEEREELQRKQAARAARKNE